jgi:urease accessory protein
MSNGRSLLRVAFASVAALVPTAAWAHVGAGSASGFAHGFVHPMTGIDHLLAMVAVGMLAANLGGRALWALPLTFLSVMAAGGALGVAGFALPMVEAGIAASVILLGLAVALQWKWPVAAAMALVGIFAVFHGHAHGAEMPVDASGFDYGLGFLLATALLHGLGIGLGAVIARFGRAQAPRVMRFGGGAMALAGVGILAGVL